MPRIREHLVEGKNRHGNIRYQFHRLPDGRRITIKGKPGEAAFEARYAYLSQGGDVVEDLAQSSVKRQREGARPELIKELVRLHSCYLDKLVDQGDLSQHTADHYARFTRRFSEEFGTVGITSVEEEHLEQILNHWSQTSNAYNNALRAIKHLFRYAERLWGFRPNPCRGLVKREVSTDGFKPWSIDDLRKYFDRHKLGTKAHLTMKLLMHVAPRVSDLVKLGPSNIVSVDGVKCIQFKPQKTNNVWVTVPLHEDLQEALDATETGEVTFLVTAKGNPHSAKGFCNQVALWREQAGIAQQVSAHGMRKTVGIDLAENGATEYELMAALGHRTPKVTEVYTRGARRSRLAIEAMSKSSLGSLSRKK